MPNAYGTNQHSAHGTAAGNAHPGHLAKPAAPGRVGNAHPDHGKAVPTPAPSDDGGC